MMKHQTEYNISNSLIWVSSAIIPIAMVQLFRNVDHSALSFVDWVMCAAIVGFQPALAILYRSKIVIKDGGFEIYRGIIGGIWFAKSTPRKYAYIIYPESDQNGRLSIVLEEGKVIAFDPVKNLRDRLIRKAQSNGEFTKALEPDTLKQAFWPVTQSIDFAKSDIHSVAAAVQSEIERYSENKCRSTSLKMEIRNLKHIKDVFSKFTTTPTQYLVLTLNSEWSFILSNSFLCDGHDSLMYNITRIYGYDTIHMVSHDKTTTFLPGSRFHYRKAIGNTIIERELSCSVNDSNKWEFYESGERQSWEDGADYTSRKKKERLNERAIEAFLKNLGINVYDPDTLIFPLNAVMVSQGEVSKSETSKTKHDIMIPYA